MLHRVVNVEFASTGGIALIICANPFGSVPAMSKGFKFACVPLLFSSVGRMSLKTFSGKYAIFLPRLPS